MKTTSRSIRANDWAGAENSIRIAFEHFQAPHVAQANWLENELPRVSSKTKSNLSLSNCICCAFFSLPTDELREMSWLMSHQGIIFINERLFCAKLARWVPAVEKKSLVGKSPKGSFNVNIAIIFIHKLLRAACELQLMMSIKVSRLKCNLDRFCANSYWHQPVPVTVSRAGATDFKCKFLSLYFSQSKRHLRRIVIWRVWCQLKMCYHWWRLADHVAPFCAKITNYWNYRISRWAPTYCALFFAHQTFLFH